MSGPLNASADWGANAGSGVAGPEALFGNNGSVTYISTMFQNNLPGSLELVVSPAPVPLPAAAWLMLSGLGGLGALRRKKSVA